MTTEDVKKFLFEQTNISISNWKRISKHKSADGSEIRIFQDKVTGKTLETLETIEKKNGNISILESIILSQNSKPKVIGYYQFDEELFSVALVTKIFWEKNRCLDDSGSEEEYVPKRFYELSEGIYEHDFSSHKEAIEALENIGFVARNFLDEMNN
jgi:hypothetical protein